MERVPFGKFAARLALMLKKGRISAEEEAHAVDRFTNEQPKDGLDALLRPPLFDLGEIVATQSIDADVKAGRLQVFPLIERHACGDFGRLDGEDVDMNIYSLATGARLLSAYDTPVGEVWVITDAESEVDAPPYYKEGKRPATTVLRPDEY